MSLAKPKSAIFMTLLSVTKTFLAAKSRWMHWKQKKKEKNGPVKQTAAKVEVLQHHNYISFPDFNLNDQVGKPHIHYKPVKYDFLNYCNPSPQLVFPS